jgi:hypothetical protein
MTVILPWLMAYGIGSMEIPAHARRRPFHVYFIGGFNDVPTGDTTGLNSLRLNSGHRR